MGMTIGDLIVNLVFGNEAGMRADLVNKTSAAGMAGGTAASKGFASKFRAGLSRENLGKGFVQGLGLGAGLGAVTAVAAGVRFVTDAIGGSIDAALGWESAMAGVSKTLDTTGLSAEEAEEALADIEDGLRSMAKEIPLPVEQLAALAEAGGALGIARDDLLAFVRTSALLGTTTDIAAEDAAKALGKVNAVMPLAREEYSRFAATLVDLGNKGASTEAEIVAMAQNMAGAAGLIGLSHDQLLGWASALANVGEEAEAGGSSFQKFVLGINTAVSQSTPRLTEIAEVAGLTREAFADMWGADANEAMRLVVNGLSRMDQGARQATLSALGFKDIRITRAFLALTNNVQNLNQSLTVGEEAWDANSAAAIEAEKRFGTTENKIATLNNQLHDFAIDAGGVLVDLGLFLSDLLNAVRRGIDGENAAIEDTREQVRLLAREHGMDEAAAVSAYDAEVKRLQLTQRNIAAITAAQSALRVGEFLEITAALTDVGNGLSITTGWYDDLIARVRAMNNTDATAALDAMAAGGQATAEQMLALSGALEQVREDSIVILTDALRDLSVETGKPLADVLQDAQIEMGYLSVETTNLSDLIENLRTRYGLVGPAAEEAAKQQADAMEFIRRLQAAQAQQDIWGRVGVGAGIKGAATDLAADPALVAAWMELGIGFAFDLTGGVRRGVKESEPELKAGVLELRAAMTFDWGAEVGYVLGKQFGRWVGRGLRSDNPEFAADAQNFALAGLEAIWRSGRDGPRAADKAGQLLAGLYASGMSSEEVEVRLSAAGLSLTALEAIARKAGWQRAGDDVAGEWTKGVKSRKGGKGGAREAGRSVNDAAQTAINNDDGWGSGGSALAQAWLTGLKDVLRVAPLQIIPLLGPVLDLLAGDSPPPKGPLRHIDVGGANVGSAWREAFLGEIGISDRDVAGAFGGLTGFGGLSLPPITFSGQMAGLDTHASGSRAAAMLGSSSTVNHGPTYNVSVQGLIRAETPEDIGRTLRRVGRLGAGA